MKYLLLLSNESYPNRKVACVDTLGQAQKLVALDECKMKLTTELGEFTLDRREYEPAYSICGFVGVELDWLPNETIALYFDVRITAALVKLHALGCCSDAFDRIKPGQEIPLMNEADSWEYIRSNMEVDCWSLYMVARELSWVDIKGKPIPTDCSPDVNLFIFLSGQATNRVGELDNRLWMLTMSVLQTDEENKYKLPYEYLARRNAAFLSARYAHHLG